MAKKLLTLSCLYFIQGLPYGFQLIALPVYLRSQGVSLEVIGLASALSLPWAIKVLWGPPMDRFASGPFGKRRTWILPLQVGLMLACVGAAFITPLGNLTWLVAAILTMNLIASAMDVAVDGLAVDQLRPQELGYGNIAQVVGYKLGILTGGGLLVSISETIGWQGLFLIMAGLIALGLLVTATFREGPPVLAASHASSDSSPSIGQILRTLFRALRVPGTGWLLLFIGTYKMGESIADAMFKPFLYDSGFTAEQIGWWSGTWGMLFSLAGSFAGGLLASRIRILHAVGLAAFLRALAVGGEWWLTLVGPTPERALGVIAAENLFGGALTTAMFAYMMSRVDRRIGATHYTLLATVEVVGKLSASAASGFLAQRLGYGDTFALATALALAFLLLLIPLRRVREDRMPKDPSETMPL